MVKFRYLEKACTCLHVACTRLQICYDMKAGILYITIIKARNLMKLNNDQLPDPFVKCYLLPPRIIENQRRTRYFSRCVNPVWKQTMVYPQIKVEDLKKKYLEISVWSFDIYKPHTFLGQVVIHLSDVHIFYEEPVWYQLVRDTSESSPPLEVKVTPKPRYETVKPSVKSEQRPANIRLNAPIHAIPTKKVSHFVSC
ncbi:rabphilin-3A-like protein [Dinothrombium tinctorium]|uniref:Rabphilin-3A-like protein n=1 Tax=Dinothrombium tinctorium TaxID=1965070 RepID=A0A3S3P4Y9_9ACAR|nr:rabphilin-3A-like protein [Dinothrombium tinctorium]